MINGSKSKPRVVVAMSGGVDSSVAACLLHRQGYDVIGVTMRLWSEEAPAASRSRHGASIVSEADKAAGSLAALPGELTAVPDDSPAAAGEHQGCCSIDDIEDARRVCQTLGVPHYVLNVEREFRQHVMDYFVAEYQRGRTPHPCIACNDRIKFDFLMTRAAMMDAAYVATGHYARSGVDAGTGRHVLLRGVDPAKDQSYVLFGLTQERLAHVLLPVGAYDKGGIRRVAAEAGLHLADKADSQEICFIPYGDYREFLKRRVEPQPGEFVDTEGRVLGEHPGIEFFTVGQRRGLGLPATGGEKRFVVRVEPDTCRVVLGSDRDLLHQGVRVERINYISGAPPAGPVPVTAKVRYNGRDAPGMLMPTGHAGDEGPCASPLGFPASTVPGRAGSRDGDAVLWFDEPQRAIAPGQAAVFYDGDRVIGGGYIEGPADLRPSPLR